MIFSRISLLLSTAATAAALVLVGGCRDGQERARHELNAASVPFTIADFIQAAHDGRSTLLEEFLAAGMNPDVSHADGATPLLAAAAQGQGEAVKLLLAGGASATRTGPDGSSPLFAAVRSGDERSVNALIAAGADPAIPGPGGESCLTIAAGLGHAVLVELLLPLVKELPDPALRLACVKGNTAAMDVLLTGGADINLADDQQQTPVMLAAAAGQLPAVKMLCYRQARLSLRDASARTAAELARTLGQDSTASFLEEWAVRHPEGDIPPSPVMAAVDSHAVPASGSGPAGPDPNQTAEAETTTVPASFSPGEVVPALPPQSDPPEVKPLSDARFPDLACDAVNDVPGLLSMTSYQLRPWPLLLKDVDRDHESADVELTQEDHRIAHLRVGSAIPGTGCVVEKLRRRRVYADVNETKLVNASEMVFRQTSTGDVFRATPDKPVFSRESSAFVRIAGSPVSWTATTGDAFRLGTSLLVVTSVDANSLTLENRLTRETVVVTLSPG